MRRIALLLIVLCGAFAAAAQPAGEGPGASTSTDEEGAASAGAETPAAASSTAEGEDVGAEPPAAPSGAAAPAPAPPPGAAGDPDVEVERVDGSAPAAPGSGEQAYDLKITELESRVNELKEKIFRSKTRLAILKETVLASSIAGAEAQIIHRNEMGSGFRLEKVVYSLDGAPIFSRVDVDGDLDEQEEIEIFNGPIVPGNHTVSVVMVYRGSGYGIFSYLKGYVFRLRDSRTFRAEEGKKVVLKVIGFERGGITTDLKDRPYIRFEQQLVVSQRAPRAAAAQTADDDG